MFDVFNYRCGVGVFLLSKYINWYNITHAK